MASHRAALPAPRPIPWYRRLEARVVLGVSLIAGLSLVSLSLVAGRVVRAHALARAAGDLTAARIAFEHLIDARTQSAAARSRLVTALPVFRAHMTDQRLASDASTMGAMAEAYRRELGAEFCLVSDSAGRPLASPGLSRSSTAAAAIAPAVADARAGLSHHRIVAIDDGLFLVVSEPATFADEVLGTLTVGYRLDDDVALELAQTTRCDIALVAGSRIAGASFTGGSRQRLGEMLATGATDFGRPHDASLKTLGAVQYVAGTFPLGADGETDGSGRLILLEDWEPTQRFVDDIQAQLLWTGAGVFVFALAGSLVVSRRMARPLTEIAAVAERIAAGDWNQRVPVRGSAEAVALAEAFNGMTASLKDRDEQLRQSQKMEAVGTLAGGVAHDFNNLLMAIHGYGELLMLSLEQGDERRTDLQEIMRATERAASLTRQLLAFSRKQILAPQVVHLPELVSGVQKMLHRLIGEDIELRTRFEAGVHCVRADPGQLEQVITNLAINARDAMPLGGRIDIELRNTELSDANICTHLGMEPGSYVTIAVTDTGPGIDPEIRSRIFEPFFTTKEPGKGTGLGLAMVYGIVKQSGGAIDVDTALGRGTTFRIHLPAVDAVDESNAAPDGLPPAPTGPETLLVVEDELTVRTLLVNTLRKNGYVVLDAANGNDALEVARRHAGPIHLLLTDVVMPGMGGGVLWQILSSLRPETKVMFMTGHTDDAVVRHGIDVAAVSFLQKPFSLDTLGRELRRTLDENQV
jgi:signal transduction histidine kinase/CheY-like chemotaxis protein